MVRKVVADTGTSGLADFEMLLQECTSTKNSMQRTNGYSASQWVLGKQPRMPGSVTDMSESADLGVIEAKTDPTVAYHKVHAARMSAQRAFVHLDTSNRVARALTRNAAPQHKEYAVGDLVCYRRDARQGGTTWSTASRVIGHDPRNGLWLLHEGVPILCSTSRVRSANESEALAFSILNGVLCCQMPLCQALNNRSTSILKMNNKDQSSQTQLGSLMMMKMPLRGAVRRQELQQHQGDG